MLYLKIREMVKQEKAAENVLNVRQEKGYGKCFEHQTGNELRKMYKMDGWVTIWRRIKLDISRYFPGILAAVSFYFLLRYLFGGFCPSVLVTGFPCPGCGMTRALLYLLQGNFERAFALNPSVFLWAIWVLCFCFERYIRGRKPKAIFWAAVMIVLCMTAVYTYRMVTLFPKRPPYVYTRNNLFARYVPGYARMMRRLIG